MEDSKSVIETKVQNGWFPPYIVYKIIYNSAEEKRVKPALVKVALHGADVHLSFSCRIKEQMSEFGVFVMHVC